MELVIPKDDKVVKKEQKFSQNFSQSKQTFDQVRFLQAVNGNIVLRGRNGRRDQIYLLPRACMRFWRMYFIWKKWMQGGFTTQCDQLGQVLQNWGAAIQEAIIQRLSANGQLGPIPKWCDAKFMAKLSQAVLSLSGK